MATCRLCERSGFFFSVNENGLCKTCQPIWRADVEQRVRILTESAVLAHEGKTFGTRLSRCDLVLEHARHLQEYERRNIPSTDPDPTVLLTEYVKYRDQLIREECVAAAEKATAKASVTATQKSKHSALGAGILKVQEIAANSEDSSLAKEIVAKLRALMHQAQLDGFLDAAKKAEFKGNKKKAIDQYQEALYFVRNDGIPDEQQAREIGGIEGKLKELES